jgi:nitroimidazol reductase NimA-like FMN-containing flavoprotein (pyridoxamine 5'-phosphate oxidase superfamily)
MEYSSIVGYGHIHIVSDESEKLKGLDIIMSHYGGENHSGYDNRVLRETTILRLEITGLTAKRKSENA